MHVVPTAFPSPPEAATEAAAEEEAEALRTTPQAGPSRVRELWEGKMPSWPVFCSCGIRLSQMDILWLR